MTDALPAGPQSSRMDARGASRVHAPIRIWSSRLQLPVSRIPSRPPIPFRTFSYHHYRQDERREGPATATQLHGASPAAGGIHATWAPLVRPTEVHTSRAATTVWQSTGATTSRAAAAIFHPASGSRLRWGHWRCRGCRRCR